jgi:hypothetical protein
VHDISLSLARYGATAELPIECPGRPTSRQLQRDMGHPNFVATWSFLVVEVFAPFVIGVTDHAHDVAAGVQGKGARLAQQLDVGQLTQQMIAFSAVTGVAAGYQVFPGRKASAGARQYVVQREFACRQYDAAVLATVAVT